MHKSVGVRSAIQSLAGIYIYDYQPLDSIRERVNRRFEDAERRFSQLLNDPATYRDESRANELITIGVILSMQDVSHLSSFHSRCPVGYLPSTSYVLTVLVRLF